MPNTVSATGGLVSWYGSVADRTPFANGSEFQYWTWRNCERGNGCVHDSTWGAAPEPETWCPLIDAALKGEWPEEWPVIREVFVGECTNYREAR